MSQPTIHEIKAGILAGTPKIFEHIDELCRSQTTSLVLKNNGTREDAEDVYQSTLLDIWYAIKEDRFTPIEGAFGAFAHRIARNKWMNHLKNRKKYMELDLNAISDEWYDENWITADKAALSLLTNKHVQMLSEKKQHIFELYYYEKLPQKTIAQMLNTTEKYIKKVVHQTREELRRSIHSDPELIKLKS